MTTILFADDNPAIREYSRQQFEDDGYHVLLAANGVEACCCVGRQRPDVVILDISMPRMDGLAAAEQIRGLEGELPVIFFTAHDEACLADARSQLADACVEKSEDLTELKRVVNSLLVARRRGQPYRTGLPPASNAAPSCEVRMSRALC